MASTDQLTVGQHEIVAMISAQAADEPKCHCVSFETWYDNTDGTLGVSYTSDSLTTIVYFDRDGNMIGNWC